MSLVYGLKLMCDLTHYVALIVLVGLARENAAKLIALSLLLGVGAGVGFRLADRGERARYLPLVMGALVLLMGLTRVDVILAIPVVVYSFMYIKGNRRETDYYYAYERFRRGLLPVALLLVISLLNGVDGFAAAVPALFLHLALSVALLRMLRHERHVIVQRRFQALNLLSILSVCAVGFALSTNWVLGWLRRGLLLVCDCVLLPVIQALVWGIEAVVRALNWLVSLLPLQEEGIGLPTEQMPGVAGPSQGSMMPATMADVAANPLLRQILQIGGVVLLCVVAFFVLRALSKQPAHEAEAERKEQRESIDLSGPLRSALGDALRRRGDPVLGVRHIYRRFLKTAEGRNIPLNGCQNSLQIRDLSQSEFDAQALDDLRAVYIRARYDGTSSEEALAQAKDALSRLKRK